jgi:uncharacterized protein with PIN domain
VGRVEVRVHGDLQDLLAPDRRDGILEVRFDVAPSVKDAIEALGVPHTEVAAITVDGEPVGFDHRLADGQIVEVLPPPGLAGVASLRPPAPAMLAFVLDGHLGTLARRLRLLGFDAEYRPDRSDADLARRSASSDRILLTRDRGLLKRREVVHAVLVRHDDPDDQVLDVLRRVGATADHLRPFTRCPICNGELEPVAKSAVLARLPPGTARDVDAFERCTTCDHLYWVGSHHERLGQWIDSVHHALAPHD